MHEKPEASAEKHAYCNTLFCRRTLLRSLFVITGQEPLCCPLCGAQLRPYDRRTRQVKDKLGDSKVYSLRRLRCQNPSCHRLHIELPDFILPYKRYEVEVFEQLAGSGETLAPYESRTRRRMKRWYEHFVEVAQAILALPSHVSDLSLSVLAKYLVTDARYPTTRMALSVHRSGA